MSTKRTVYCVPLPAGVVCIKANDEAAARVIEARHAEYQTCSECGMNTTHKDGEYTCPVHGVIGYVMDGGETNPAAFGALSGLAQFGVMKNKSDAAKWGKRK